MVTSTRQVRRRVYTRVALQVVVLLAALDVCAYIFAQKPLAEMLVSERGRYALLRKQWRAELKRTVEVERRVASLPAAGERMKGFLRQHVPPRRQGFSRAARLVWDLSRSSNVELANLSYHLDERGKDPLERMGISVLVQGSFNDILNFAHSLETSPYIVMVRSFAFVPGDKGVLGLRVTADLYLMP
jgi:Tfp pilus assembly protein PilO